VFFVFLHLVSFVVKKSHHEGHKVKKHKGHEEILIDSNDQSRFVMTGNILLLINKKPP